MITTTTIDLQSRLDAINSKLEPQGSLEAEPILGDQTFREQLEAEKEGIQKCLEICGHVSTNIEALQSKYTEDFAGPSGNDERNGAAYKPALPAFLAAASNLAGYKEELEARLQRLSEKLHHYPRDPISAAHGVAHQDLLQEMEGIRASIDICNSAFREAERNRTNVYEDISMAEEGRQVIVSTVGHLIFARNIKAGSRVAQIFGQMSDETVQRVSDFEPSRSPQPEDSRARAFGGRYGTGHNLRATKSSSQM
jgi:hypothetical protein